MYPIGSGNYLQDYRYQYTPSQQLYRIDNASGVLQWEFAHNGVGETLSRAGQGQHWAFEWNAAGRLVRSTRQGQAHSTRPGHLFAESKSGTAALLADGFEPFTTTAPVAVWESHVYDAHGHRTRSTRSTGTTRHQVYTREGRLLYTEDTKDNERIDY